MRHSLVAMVMSAMLAVYSVASARAQPAAIVEDVAGDGIGVEIMEILARGRVIDLSPGQTVVLGYMNSCVRERIGAGRVVVGENQSTVTEGNVEREKVECQSEAIELPGGVSEGAGLVFRGGDSKPESRPTLRYRAPIFLVDGVANTTLLIERVDRAEAIREFAMSGPVLDLAGMASPLSPGGKYQARAGAPAPCPKATPR